MLELVMMLFSAKEWMSRKQSIEKRIMVEKTTTSPFQNLSIRELRFLLRMTRSEGDRGDLTYKVKDLESLTPAII